MGIFSAVSILFGIILLLGFRINFFEHRNTSGKLSVLSFNIRCGEINLNQIIKTLAESNADIICLQEAHAGEFNDDPVPQIQSALKNYYQARYGELVIFSRHAIIKNQSHSLPGKNGLGVLETKVKINQRELSAYNLHFMLPMDGNILSWSSTTKQRAAVRKDQLNLISTLVVNNKKDFIIAGDFNSQPDTKFHRKITSLGSDSFKAQGNSFGYTFHAAFPWARIDYILFSKNLSSTYYQTINIKASDHRPIYGEYEWHTID